MEIRLKISSNECTIRTLQCVIELCQLTNEAVFVLVAFEHETETCAELTSVFVICAKIDDFAPSPANVPTGYDEWMAEGRVCGHVVDVFIVIFAAFEKDMSHYLCGEIMNGCHLVEEHGFARSPIRAQLQSTYKVNRDNGPEYWAYVFSEQQGSLLIRVPYRSISQ